MSHALRHAPADYGLTLNTEGWVSITVLAEALAARQPGWSWLTSADVTRVAANSAKKRFEVDGPSIRAAYGHSLATEISHPLVTPPSRLFHATSAGAALVIAREGLTPMARQYVHLATTPDAARAVGLRHDKDPVLFEVDAHAAHSGGIRFFEGSSGVFLAHTVPAEYLKRTA